MHTHTSSVLIDAEGKATAAANDTQVDRPWALWREKALGKQG